MRIVWVVSLSAGVGGVVATLASTLVPLPAILLVSFLATYAGAGGVAYEHARSRSRFRQS